MDESLPLTWRAKVGLGELSLDAYVRGGELFDVLVAMIITYVFKIPPSPPP